MEYKNRAKVFVHWVNLVMLLSITYNAVVGTGLRCNLRYEHLPLFPFQWNPLSLQVPVPLQKPERDAFDGDLSDRSKSMHLMVI